MRRGFLISALTLIAFSPAAFAQVQQADPLPADPAILRAEYEKLYKQIEQIPILDIHSHPGYADDPGVDAMAAPPQMSISERLRADNPELILASRDLFNYPYDDASPEHLKWLVDKKAQLRHDLQGTEYFDRILDKLNIERAVANRPALGPYLNPKRFPWVFFVDSVLFPFDNKSFTSKNIDLATYVPLQEQKLHHELTQESLSSLPADFSGYLAFITKLLEDNQRHGGIGIKFEIAYFRTLHFDNPSIDDASAIYARYRSGGAPSQRDYLLFQDYLFRYLLREAGRLQLPVHIHTSVGIGDFFSVTESGILQLEPILRDPRYDSTKFVLLHGGYPWEYQAIWLTARQNVYLDSSYIELYLYPADFKKVLRTWLTLFPDKIVYGSDAFPFNDAVGAEESYWLGVHSVRRALAAALAEMVTQHEISEAKALAFAHAYLHDTAAPLVAPLHK